MEKMPYRPEMDTQLQTITAPVAEIISTDWRSGLPVSTTLISFRFTTRARTVTTTSSPPLSSKDKR